MKKRKNKILHGYIYCHLFPNGKRYIGQTTVSLSKRFGKNGSNYNKNPLVWKAIQKYKWENIQHIILEEGDWSLEEINAKEQYYIDLYNSRSPNGYNLTKGGDMPAWDSQMIIQLDRISLKPLKTFESLTEAAKAVGGSVECICQCCKRQIRTADNYCWCYASDYYEGWKPCDSTVIRHPKVYCLETNSVYESFQDAADQLGVYATKIRAVCAGKMISTHGFHFCYEQDKDTYKIKEKRGSTPIICLNTEEESPSIIEASRKMNCNYADIKRCLNGRKQQVKGLKWKYKEGPRRPTWNNKN